MMNFHHKETRLGNVNVNLIAGNTANDTIATFFVVKRNRGGRPLGSSVKRKREIDLDIVATANEITIVFKNEKKEVFSTNKRMNKGHLTKLVNEIKAKNNISPDIPILEDTIRRQTLRKVLYYNGIGGHHSPLTPIDPTIVSAIIQMACIR